MRRFSLVGIAAILVLIAVGCTTDAGDDSTAVVRNAAPADQQGVLVSMGDSYISGTAGRWRGNSNGFTNLPQNLEAFRRSDTGANAYDNFGREFPGEECFRSRSAVIHLGGNWTSVNVACSNARTATRVDDDGKVKPGLDAGGQLDLLTDVAAAERVRLVAVSIGANDFRFGPTVKNCVTGFLASLSAFPRRCSEDPEALATISPDAVATNRTAIARALEDIVVTMREAGYADDDWVLVSHNYPAPLPLPSAMRYPESGYVRQVTGDGAARSGTCGAPADWGATNAAGEPLVAFTPA